MSAAPNNRPAIRWRTLAGLIAPLFIVAGSVAGGPGQDAGQAMYSVINLDPEGGMAALLNENGQAAFGSFVFGTAGFFDGERTHDIGSLGGGGTVVRSLNRQGVVVGDSQDASEPFGQQHAFRWTAGGGIRAIPNSLDGLAYDVNDSNQVAGSLPAPGGARRAVRWEPDGRIVRLGPLPASLSEASAIDQHAFAGGFADFTDGRIHATLWDPTGHLLDLGTLGGQRAFTLFLNDRGEAAGTSDNTANDAELGFFWSRATGMLPIGAQGGFGRFVADLNERGEVVGDTGLDPDRTGYLWSRARGLVLLPRGAGVRTDVFDINNNTQMVGLVEDSKGEQRAVRWNGLSAPVDLNTLLVRPPPGLVLQAGAAINDAGAILAYSNAGLVMLRPGTRGTDAPVLGPVTGLPQTLTLGQEARLHLGFVDNSPTQTHTATVNWGDNCPSPHPLVREAGGVGQVSFQHRFCNTGYYQMRVQVTDSTGRTTEQRKEVFVNPPGVAALSGQGTLARGPAAAGRKAPPLQFRLWAPAGTGASFVALDGPFRFRSEQVGAPAGNGQQMRVEGTGRLNGRPGYRFLVDAGGARVRVKVSHGDAAGAEVVDYDNGPADASPGGAVGAAATAATPAASERTMIVRGGLTLSQ